MKKIIFIGSLLLVFSCAEDKKYDIHTNMLMEKMHSMSAGMKQMQMTMDPDHDFAMMMKMHHMGAIDMAGSELWNGNDQTIKEMAQMMKDAQQMEIAELDSFLNVHAAVPDNEHGMEFINASDAAMSEMDASADAQKLNGDYDHDFAHLMIPHHQGATEMAQAGLEHGKIQMLKDMAQKMIDDQQKEIADLQNWLNSSND